LPGAELISSRPPDCSAIPNTWARPSPVPRPTALVVKNGSIARARVASSIPAPWSVIAIITSPSAGVPAPATVTLMADPGGDASRALIMILSTASSSWVMSPIAHSDGSSATIVSRWLSPID